VKSVVVRRLTYPYRRSFISIASGQNGSTMTTDETPKDRADEATDDRPGKSGAEDGASSSDSKAPFAPHEDDDSELGDTDQHSDA
jgi:hypothetical protein